MALGRRIEQTQAEFWIATDRLAPAPAHPFYQKLNQVLAAGGFDPFCQASCEKSTPRSWAGRAFRRRFTSGC